MTDEVSEHMRMSLTVWMIGGLLMAVVGVTVFSLLIFNNYSNKYSDAMVQSTTSAIYEMSRQQSVTCPQVYSAVSASISEVATVKVKMSGDTGYRTVYTFNDPNGDNLISLMTGVTATKNVRMTIDPSDRYPSMIDITLEEVVR